jgi:translocation and assembly module TamB
MFWFLVVLLILLLALGGGAWWWSGTHKSLATVLTQAARHLPAGQSLETRDVTGSVRTGGRIGWLHWQSPTLAVEVNGADIGWQLAPLLKRKLQLGELHATRVVIERRGPVESKTTEPLDPIVLPIDIDLPFRVDELRWNGPPAISAVGLNGHYRYDKQQHQLDITGVALADGQYSAHLTLQGNAPMALAASLEGRVRAPMPEGAAPLTVLANATVKGTLAGVGARLQIAASLRSEPSDAASVPSSSATPTAPAATASAALPKPVRALVEAQIAPWAPQPIVSAKADLANVDAARLWPGAPQTLLSGQLTAGPEVQPAGSPAAPLSGTTVWLAHVDVRNAQPGPWDKQRLPLERINASARFDGVHWTVSEAALDVGGGQIQAQGQWSPAPDPWQATVKVSNVKPAALHSELDATPVDGTAKVSQKDAAIAFDVALQARSRIAASSTSRGGGVAVAGLRIDSALAQGEWRGQTLDVKTLRIDSGAARVEGHLKAQLDTLAGEGKLDLSLPGGAVQLAGRMGRLNGTGDSKLKIDDAATLQRWIEALPGQSAVFAGASAQGSAQLDMRWQGGWESWKNLVLSPSNAPAPAASRGDALRLQAQLAIPKLDLKLPSAPATAIATTTATPATTLRLQGVRADLASSPADATLALDGEAALGLRTFTLRTRASGSLTGRDQFRIALASLRVQMQDTGVPTTTRVPWTFELDSPLNATMRRTLAATTPASRFEFDASAGSASVRGPVPGTARLEWQPVKFSQVASSGDSGSARYRLRTQGKLSGLPMAWAGALSAAASDASSALEGQDSLATLGAMGISGDLIFDGDWDIDAGDTLRAQARLARRSGDLRVQAGETALVTRIQTHGTGTPAESSIDSGAAGPTTPAGLRQAELVFNAQGDAVRAQLTWDSERAGQVKADASTRVVQRDGGWQWADDAPLAGQVRARLPNIGVWSMLAPPGWRVQGTLEADAKLAGNRAVPQWNGSLSADGLSVKALVEGIDLRDGRLRAALRGNRLELTEFTLRGGAASSARITGQSGNLSTARSEAANDGGTLTATGNLSWGAASATGSGIGMNVDAEATALRLLVRTDRQASVSGQLQLRMDQGQFSVRGKLKTVRAVIILPDETAPSLGSDVIVRSAARDRETARVAQREKARAEQADQAEKAEAGTAARARTSKPPDIDVSFDLGDDFAVQGRGVTTRLTGQIDVRSNAGTGSVPRLTGEIRTVKGQYRAYGQQLDIESGVARFSGPYDNPALDILAIRPNITQRAGVQITGSALSPRVKLYSEPSLSDAETLSWVVLGRASANGGAEALLMQQAALALLSGLGQKGSGNLASRFGLDEIGFKGPSGGEDVRNSAITLGKRLSKDFYVTYERSLAGTLGTLYIFYDLTRRLTLRGQAGTQSALDLIYTFSYD